MLPLFGLSLPFRRPVFPPALADHRNGNRLDFVYRLIHSPSDATRLVGQDTVHLLLHQDQRGQVWTGLHSSEPGTPVESVTSLRPHGVVPYPGVYKKEICNKENKSFLKNLLTRLHRRLRTD